MNAAGAWVRASDRLPETIDVYPFGWRESDPVLVCTLAGSVFMAQWVTYDPADDYLPYWRLCGRDGYTCNTVTHWAIVTRPGD